MVAGFPGLFAKVGSVVDQVYRSEAEALGIHSGVSSGINGLRRTLGGGYKAESADLHGVLGKPFAWRQTVMCLILSVFLCLSC